MIGKLWRFIKALAIVFGLALLTGIVVGLTYFFSILISALGIIIVIGLIVAAFMAEDNPNP